MAGDAPGCTEWARAYDDQARKGLQACTNLADALTNFGNILFASGYNYGISNNSDPAPPRPTIVSMTEYTVDLPSATTAISGNGVHRNDDGGEFFDRFMENITNEFKKLPNADVDALGEVSATWSAFANSEALAGLKSRVEAISQRFDNLDAVENRALIQQHLNTIGTSADTMTLAASNIAAPLGEFKTSIVDANQAVRSAIISFEWAVALSVGVAVVGALFSLGGSVAVGAGTAALAATQATSAIRTALNAQKLLRILGFSAAFGSAVGAITAFDGVPDTGAVITSLATIITTKVLLLEVSDDINGGAGAFTVGSLTTSVGKLAKEYDVTEREIREAIHKVKAGGAWRGNGAAKNPDVVIDTKTGEAYPKNADGTVSEDSIGNITDFLPEE
ncbi:hypothetical protein [Nocardia sp. NPDC058666]|uniref:hypothetical protein n=1 Tax=Nocardia sp. NPDC058666 TaxID=3346587 RepID=UPI00365E0C24